MRLDFQFEGQHGFALLRSVPGRSKDWCVSTIWTVDGFVETKLEPETELYQRIKAWLDGPGRLKGDEAWREHIDDCNPNKVEAY